MNCSGLSCKYFNAKIIDLVYLDHGNNNHHLIILLDIVNLKDTKKPVIQYSYGMKQRLALALALANKPKLLFLDEPLNGLDPQGIRDIRSLIRKLCDEGTTIIISSHILDELQKIVTHVGLLQNGHLIKECEIEKISDTSLENYYFNEFEGENK